MKTSAGQRYTREVATLQQLLPEAVTLNVLLAPLVGYRVGGPADALVVPRNRQQLQQVVRFCKEHNVPYFILGEGANLLVADEGIPGVVIRLHQCCNELYREDTRVYVGTGRLVSELVLFCEQEGLAGLEFMSGIPGTVGGALRMNAGAFVGEIGDRVVTVEAMDASGNMVTISAEQAGFGYRRADGLTNYILLGTWLQLHNGDSARLREAREQYLARRAQKQPLEYPSCGSVFKRPPGDYAGRLIEAAGCKGLRVGNAQVSPKHANFIVNLGGATARDIVTLIQKVQQTVFNQFGVWLEPEVKLVGFPSDIIESIRRPSNATQTQ